MFTQIQITVFWNFVYNHTKFEIHCSRASSYLLPFILQHYVNSTINNITWNFSVVERLLQAIIRTGAHLNEESEKMEVFSFYSSILHLWDFIHYWKKSILMSRKESVRQWVGEITMKVISQHLMVILDLWKRKCAKLFKNKIKKDEKENTKSRQKRLGDLVYHRWTWATKGFWNRLRHDPKRCHQYSRDQSHQLC